MKKKIVSLCLVVAMLAIAIVGGTMAYFTDFDSDKNVMTLGNVNIDQIEDFSPDAPLLPMVDNREANDLLYENGYFNTKMKNVVTKTVTVKNEAAKDAVNSDAYVRTIILFETNNEYKAGTDEVLRDGAKIFDTYIGVLGNGLTYTDTVVEINGVKYIMAYKVYERALAPQEESEPSLKQLFLSPEAGNEVQALFGDKYDVLVLSQGTQIAGFDTAAEALDTAFGAITPEKLVEWFASIA